MQLENYDQCLDDEITTRKTDSEVKEEIEATMDGKSVERLSDLEIAQRNEILHQIKKSAGVTQRQIARVTGISQNIVFKA